ncbi:hypothetical protein VNO77_02621 [Canavalia gladiata]|uniref:Uncharacterized protein n=1 Tax=Canavalia gladiata TaxID=3824 RepID=A0AAN9MTI9_CANGL
MAYLEKLCPTLPNGTKVVVNCSGKGGKDVQTALNYPNPKTTKKLCKIVPDSPKCRSGCGKIAALSVERHTGPQWVVRVPS